MADRAEPDIPQGPRDSAKAAAPQDAETRSTPEILVPMLEVHAPPEAMHTWKGFFIHIATIVIGLLIAIGLEQTVEWIHHRHQLREAREEVSIELKQNRIILEKNLEEVGKIQTQLDRDIAILREHQSSHTPITAKLDYLWNFYRTPDAAWQAVKQNGTLGLMPYEELERNVYIYAVFSGVMDSAVGFNTSIEIAGAIARRSPDGNYSARETEELLTATSEAQGKLAFTARLLSFEGLELPAPKLTDAKDR